MRIYFNLIFLSFQFLAITFLIFNIITKNYIVVAILALIEIFLYNWRKNSSVVRVNLIKDTSLVLIDRDKEIELRVEDIAYVLKFVRITFTQYYALMLRVKGGNFLTARRYWFCNDPRVNLIETFEKMQIKLINVDTDD